MNTSDNRNKLQNLLEAGAAVIITSNDILPSNSDGVLGFRQNNDLYWLTGINQEQTSLFFHPTHPDVNKREVLFIKYVNDDFIKWHGKRLSPGEASAISGIKTVLWHHQFGDFIRKNACYTDIFYLQTTEHPRSEINTQTANDRLIQFLKQNYPLHFFKRLSPLMATLRSCKSTAEIDLLQKACDISAKGFNRVLKFVKPGRREKQVEAEMIHEYLQHDGDWSGYDPIVASGDNSCILHYISNHNVCKSGDTLLIDAAASYQLYNADLTRVIPVNGRYSPRQKQVYDSVLKVQRLLERFIKAGVFFKDVQDYCNELLIEEYVNLKLCTVNDLKKNGNDFYIQQYSYHGFGHYLGLDVHDVGNTFAALPVKAVTTIEPGIYIADEGLGVRIENNYVVNANGCYNLMQNIPVETEEIEELMNQS